MARAHPSVPGGDPPVAPIRFDPAAPGVLDAIASGPAPDGLRAGPPRALGFRDVYHDTEQGDLERRGAWACVRHHADGTRTLAVRSGPDGEGGAVLAVELPPDAGDAPLLGSTGPARLLRSLVDPYRLVPRVELETHRRVRTFATREGAEAEVACDAVLARDGDLRARLGEVEVRVPDGGGADHPVAAGLRHAHGLRRVGEDRLERARHALREREMDLLEEAVRTARRVAVVAVDDGRVALSRARAALRVPAGPGAGEEAARRVLRDCFGHAAARLRLLGVGPGGGERAAVEVWLAEGVGEAGEDARCEVIRLPIEEVMAAVGSPALRERDTLAALHVLARSALPLEPADTVDPRDEARARATLAAVEDEAEGEALGPGSLLNMELSVLAFNRRVLGLGEDARVPLLERVRFVSIFGANMDEFFRVRVAGFKRQVALGSEKRTIDGVTPQEQLDAIGIRARRLMDRAYALLRARLLPALAEEGIHVVDPGALTEEERAFVRAYYARVVHPLLLPLTAGGGSPFPHIRNLRPALAAMVRDPQTGARHLGIAELPDGVPRLVPLPGGHRWVPVEEVVRDAFGSLYPGMQTDTPRVFRVTRSAELHIQGEQVEDLLHAVEEQVRKRRFRPVVRLEVEEGMPEGMRALLLRELQYEVPDHVAILGDGDVYPVPALVDLRGLRELADLPGDVLHYPPAPPPREPLHGARSVFDALRAGEVLVSFPEDAFEGTVERLVVEAAEDPEVVAIKLALYRTNARSRIVDALSRAAARGKQVVALVELTARFDELSNIQWARHLRSFGIHVVYGVPGLKVHAKIALIVRREPDGVRRYAYVGTGNLNASTAALYTDLGLMTADPAVVADLNEVFNGLTGGAGREDYARLLVAPYNMRRRFVEMIEREAEHARAGREARITAKFNGLADREMIAALYRASQAGVHAELLVRGICALRPGVVGLSERIRVYSALGRYLEHARIFRFENGGAPEYYIGSADWRTRNLSRRVEVAVPIQRPEHRARLDGMLAEGLARPDLWELGADGTYYQRPELAPREVAPAVEPDPERQPIITADA